jgi:hypothetical protein
MLRRIFVLVLTLGMMLTPGVATADPPGEPPGQESNNGRLDLYVVVTSQETEAALRADGYDVVSSTPAGEQVRLEIVMSPSEAAKARKQYDLDISLKRNRDGVPTADAAFIEAQSGFEVWRTWSEPGGLRDEMEFLADQYDDLTQLMPIGESVDGEGIYAMRVTEKADTKQVGSRPAVLYLSAQHAREWISPEVTRRLLRYYLENYGSDDRVTGIVDSTELWFVLVANPDGYDYTFTEGNRLWRKNLADNNGDGDITTVDGVDLNRNFATNWGYDNEGSSDNPVSQTYRGLSPQSEPETQALDSLMSLVDFSFLINYHSAAELILYGTGWQVDTPTPDDLANIALAGTDANPAIAGYDPDLSAELYITNGDTTDHAGEAHGIMAYTPELATCATATGYIEDDEFGPTYCADEGRSGFEFPDDEELVQFEFEKNIEFALAVAESADDPANPVSPVGTPAPDFWVDEFPESWGASQEIAVWTRREHKQLRMHASINGGPAVISVPDEWEGGESYGDEGNIWYAEYRGFVPGAESGDQVEVWFSAVDTPSGGGDQAAKKIESDHFTYEVVADSEADVLIVADNSPGTPLGGTAPLAYLDYYTDALVANGYSYEVFDVGVTGPAPHPLGVLSHFDAVIWYTGDKLVTDYQGGLNTTLVAHEMNMVMRDYINEGGKVLATGKNHGFEEFFPLNYGENGAPDQTCTDPSGITCLVLTDDVYQYTFGALTRSRRGGLAPDGSALDVQGTGGVFDGYTFGLDGGDSADNQGAPGAASTGTASWIVTSSVLDPTSFPQFASERLGRWAAGGSAPFEPVTGDWQMATGHDDVAYKRLATTVDLTGASSASLEFVTSYQIETDWDQMFVEVHTVGADDWTTLPDANGHTTQATGSSCTSGWADQLHPQLFHYQTLNSDGTCSPTGTTGDWHAATGSSDGVESWNIDLSAYAGSQIEVAISFATDWATGDLGVFVDDVTVTADGSPLSETSFEDGLDSWSVLGAPPGSAPNPNDWERVGILFEVASIVATDDTLLFGFGFEGIETAEQRNEVMRRSLEHLLG